MPLPLVVDRDEADDLLHTLEAEPDDGVLRIWGQREDVAGSHLTGVEWPLTAIPAICAYLMRAAKEAGV